MAKKKKRKYSQNSSQTKKTRKKTKNWQDFREPKEQKYPLLTTRVKRRIITIVMFVLAVLISLSFFNQAGSGGSLLFKTLNFLIGKTIFFVPLLLIIGGFLFYKPQKKRVFAPIFGALVLLILGISGLFEALNISEKTGGIIGYFATWPFLKFFNILASSIIFSALVLISLLILWEFAPKKPKLSDKEKQALMDKGKKEKKDAGTSSKQGNNGTGAAKIPLVAAPQFEIKKIDEIKDKNKKDDTLETAQLNQEKAQDTGLPAEIKGEYKSPPLNLFSSSDQKPASGDIDYASAIIKNTLSNFGISVEMGEVNVGPTVTQYTLKPAEGVKLSKITGLANDLSLALAAHPIRIEAPIPGRSLVGIEVPNKAKAPVLMKDLLSLEKFQESLSPLFFPLGKDVSGQGVFADLDRMPHLLVAGSTGSGKTIFLQNLIVSLVFRNSSKILRLILVDPKRVEFPIYAPLPHLLTPVIYDAQKTVNALNWLISEMERRFDVLSQVKARNIGAFNTLISRNQKQRQEYGIMPYIILIIDELADLMAAKGREVEAGIVRLSQLARAVGIHLVVATQRPSVDVITGLIKANLTSRIAFQVASQVDSRTVLDTAGAETLLGSGDMLYISSEFGKPRRIQGCYVPQKDVKKTVEFIEKENAVRPDIQQEQDLDRKLGQEIDKHSSREITDFEADDPFYQQAKEIVLEYKKASASLLQRRLKIGYARAARLLDILEDQGVIGPADGARPRDVYFDQTKEQDQEFDNPEVT